MGNKGAKKDTPTQISDKEIAVLKANTNLSEQDIRSFYDDFKKECPSGKMNKNQFAKMYKEGMKAEDKDGKLIDNMFAVFDQNGDGSVSFSEFVVAIALANKNDLNSQLELAFEMMDTSCDGKLSYIEMVEFLRTAFSLVDDPKAKDMDPKDIATGIFKMLGADTNQKISKQQFIDGCKNNPTLQGIFGNI